MPGITKATEAGTDAIGELIGQLISAVDRLNFAKVKLSGGREPVLFDRAVFMCRSHAAQPYRLFSIEI